MSSWFCDSMSVSESTEPIFLGHAERWGQGPVGRTCKSLTRVLDGMELVCPVNAVGGLQGQVWGSRGWLSEPPLKWWIETLL